MDIQWVVAADAAEVRILERDGEQLRQVQDVKHPESREQGRDLVGNRPNQNQHSMEKDVRGADPRALHDEEAARFAKEIAGMLDTAHAQNRFRTLVLVSEPRFLGTLRGKLSKTVERCVVKSLHKHATHMPLPELTALLSDALAAT